MNVTLTSEKNQPCKLAAASMFSMYIDPCMVIFGCNLHSSPRRLLPSRPSFSIAAHPTAPLHSGTCWAQVLSRRSYMSCYTLHADPVQWKPCASNPEGPFACSEGRAGSVRDFGSSRSLVAHAHSSARASCRTTERCGAQTCGADTTSWDIARIHLSCDQR